jgi:hypothetical protein
MLYFLARYFFPNLLFYNFSTAILEFSMVHRYAQYLNG